MKLFLWLLHIVAEMVRNLVMAYVSFISELVGSISYGSCGVCHTRCHGSHMEERGWKRMLGYQLKRRERRKSVVLKSRCKMFRDNNHQSLYKKIKPYNDIECQESGTSICE